MNNSKSKVDSQKILSDDRQLGPFPEHRLKRVDKPTNLITGDVKRIDARQSGLARAGRGELGEPAQKALPRLTVKYPLSAAQKDVMLQLAIIKDNEVAGSIAPVPQDPKVLSRHIKRLGYFFKADIVGICRVPDYAVYSHDRLGNPIPLSYPYAIVIVMGKEYGTVSVSNGHDWMGDPISFQAYMRASFAAQTMANYIRRLGYTAAPQHPPVDANRYQVLMPPLLLWAGIGEVSRAGIILNPFLGLSYKAAAILTNMPLEPDKPVDFGLQEFCRHCDICAQACPSKAIKTGDKAIYNGYETWKLKEQNCTKFQLLNKRGTVCNTCVKVCPWTRPYNASNNMVRWAVEHSGLAGRMAVKMDNMLGRQKANPIPDEQWWFDLEYVDGSLTVPSPGQTQKPE